jgi:hypothetical protein
MANFSGKPVKPPKVSTEKVLIFSCLLTGSIIWMYYRASLTSELSTLLIKWPFETMETLTLTNYKYVTLSIAFENTVFSLTLKQNAPIGAIMCGFFRTLRNLFTWGTKSVSAVHDAALYQ